MTRTLFSGGSVFDPEGLTVQAADLVLEDGLVVDVGPGLDGDEAIDVTGKTLLPGMFDCHTHVAMASFDPLKALSDPFSLQFFYRCWVTARRRRRAEPADHPRPRHHHRP